MSATFNDYQELFGAIDYDKIVMAVFAIHARIFAATHLIRRKSNGKIIPVCSYI